MEGKGEMQGRGRDAGRVRDGGESERWRERGKA